MDWDAEGLLEGIESEEARAARAKLLDELHEEGVALEALRAAIAEDRLALLPAERVLASEPRYSAREVAERSGLDVDYFLASRRALGLTVPDADTVAFSDEDVESAKLGTRYRGAFPEDESLEVTRILGQGIARYAEATRAMVAHTLLEPGIDERDLARRYEALGQELLPLVGPWMDYVLRLHLLQQLREDAVTREQLATGRLEDTQDTAVAFADLVGFTSLGESAPLEELTGVAGRLGELTGELVEPPVRFVKQIGDAVMLVSPDADRLVDTVVRLVDATCVDDDFPPLRAGIAYGPAVNRWGDWYGAPVNLASRLTARARPASVLATAEVRDRAGDGWHWSSAGPKKIKGLSSPVRTYRVRRDGDDG